MLALPCSPVAAISGRTREIWSTIENKLQLISVCRSLSFFPVFGLFPSNSELHRMAGSVFLLVHLDSNAALQTVPCPESSQEKLPFFSSSLGGTYLNHHTGYEEFEWICGAFKAAAISHRAGAGISFCLALSCKLEKEHSLFSLNFKLYRDPT